jgi:galactokinase/mevalonate kinase-like predicted kinase
MCEQFKSFTLTASLLKNVEFFHVENLKQYMDLCAGLQSKQTSLWYNGQFAELRVTNMSGWILFGCSHIQMPLKKGKVSLIEGSSSCTIENALGENIFSGIKNWQTDITIPEGICIDCRVADQNNVFLVYKNTDHFSKPGTAETLTFCGKILEKWLTERCLTLSDIGVEQEPFRLADAQLFRANVSDDFLSGYWNVPSGKQWKEKFCSSHRYSLSECSSAQIGLEKDMQRQKLRASVLHTLIINGKGWVSAGVNDFEEAFLGDENNNTLEKIFETTSDILTKKYRGRLLDSIRGSRSHSSSIGFFEEHSVVKMVGGPYSLKKGQTIIVRCPVRLDLAGGWSDMPPFTLKHGGAVVNVAVNLQGVEPISVFLRRIDENCIRLHSIDKGAVYTCTKFSDFESAPIGYDLIVNALHYFGFTENEGRSLESLLEQIGGGIELTTICAVPRGSGLGGTSILTAAVLKALYSLFGKAPSLDQLLKDTIHVEQLSGAGSGWQDILGGIHGGIKLLQSAPGHFPQLKISHLNTDLFTVPHLKSCFTLVNTGLKRQNNDISMMVSDLMNENIPSYEYSLLQLKSHALETAEMVSTSNITGLGSILNKCDRTNTRIHPFLSNNEMGVLLDGVMPFYSGVKFTGAGGGGFALFISETPGKAEKLQDMLRSLKNPEVEIVDFTLNTKGLSTTIL